MDEPDPRTLLDADVRSVAAEKPGLLTTDTAVPRELRDLVGEYGAVLVRRSPSMEPSEFVALTDDLLHPITHHATGTDERDVVADRGTVSTVNKGRDGIPLHREGSYAPGAPELLAFYCERPTPGEGQTLVCDGVALFDALPADLRAVLDRTPLHWHWRAGPERWQAMLGTSDKESAEQALAMVRSRLPDYEELHTEFYGDDLVGEFRTFAAIPTGTGRKACSNSLLIHRYREANVHFAKHLFWPTMNGEPVPDSILDELNTLGTELTTRVEWQPGDVVLVDNVRCMHGRAPFSDGRRRILIRMGDLR